MKGFLGQLRGMWDTMSGISRLVSMVMVIGVALALGTLLYKGGGGEWAPVGATKHESAQLKRTLKQLGIPYRERRGLSVKKEHLDIARLQMAHEPAGEGKGFDLFDSNTWIKGERELQVLEMRALKGQLEQDLMGYENIQRARVILDMPPHRLFGSSHAETKASVILTVREGTYLRRSQLQAITYHLAGAVRGLTPKMIAVSDTTGKLYQAIDPEGAVEDLTPLLAHIALKERVDAFLRKVVGENNYYLDSEEEGELLIVMDEAFEMREEIKRQLHRLDKEGVVAIEYTSFVREPLAHVERGGWLALMSWLLFSAMVTGALWIVFRREKKSATGSYDVEKLASSIDGGNPKTLAWMLSYMEPRKAEKLLSAFDERVQEQVMEELAQLEREGI